MRGAQDIELARAVSQRNRRKVRGEDVEQAASAGHAMVPRPHDEVRPATDWRSLQRRDSALRTC